MKLGHPVLQHSGEKGPFSLVGPPRDPLPLQRVGQSENGGVAGAAPPPGRWRLKQAA